MIFGISMNYLLPRTSIDRYIHLPNPIFSSFTLTLDHTRLLLRYFHQSVRRRPQSFRTAAATAASCVYRRRRRSHWATGDFDAARRRPRHRHSHAAQHSAAANNFVGVSLPVQSMSGSKTKPVSIFNHLFIHLLSNYQYLYQYLIFYSSLYLTNLFTMSLYLINSFDDIYRSMCSTCLFI